jgi:NAD+ kinase
MQRVGVVLHPTRPVQGVLDTLDRWAATRGAEVIDLRPRDGTGGPAPPLARPAQLAECDLIAAVGGDGTVLTALHAAAATDTPVLGIACGSLGALSAVSAAGLADALDSISAGEWWARRLPALVVSSAHGEVASAVNDVVLIRRGGNQLVIRIALGDEHYASLAGDGVVVATPIGSSAYSMASGGSLVLAGVDAFVCTPLAMHGGCAPPIVVPADSTLVLDVDPVHGGFDVEVDGQPVDSAARRFELTMREGFATLVSLDEPHSGVTGLRRRGLITDSPRVLARDARSIHGGLEKALD